MLQRVERLGDSGVAVQNKQGSRKGNAPVRRGEGLCGAKPAGNR